MNNKHVSVEENQRRKRIFLWAIFVIIINTIQFFFKNWGTQALATIGTVYALYQLTVFDNKKNRLSRKYYDWRGRRLNENAKKTK